MARRPEAETQAAIVNTSTEMVQRHRVESSSMSKAAFRYPFIRGEIIHGNNLLEHFKRDIAELLPGEVVRVVSGEANWRVFHEVGDALAEAHHKKGVELRFVLGPALSVGPQYNNAIIDLAEQGIAEVYKSPWRQRQHYRVYGSRKACIEAYHRPLEPTSERLMSYVDGRLQVAGYIADFESKISTWRFSRSLNPKKEFVLLMDDDLGKLLRLAEERNIDADYLSEKEIRGLLGIAGDSEELTPDRLRLVRACWPRLRDRAYVAVDGTPTRNNAR